MCARGFGARASWVVREALADFDTTRLASAIRDPEALLLSLVQDAASVLPFVQDMADDTLASIKDAAVAKLLEVGLPSSFAETIVDTAQAALQNPQGAIDAAKGLDSAKDVKPEVR